MRVATRVLLSAVLAVSLAACQDPAPEPAGDRSPLKIVYVANEGFLLETGDDKVLIDALFREGVAGYPTTPEEWRGAVEAGNPPFDAVDLVLATHSHADHFDPRAVCAFMTANPLAEFVGTQQALDQIRAGCNDPVPLEGRVRAGLTVDREPVPFNIGALRVDPVYLTHGSDNPVENAAFVIEIGGWRLLHMGDSVASVDEVRGAGLAGRQIDLAFVPYWYLLDRNWSPAIREVVQPGGIVAMHVPHRGSPHLGSQDWDALVGSILERYGNAVVFENAFDTREFFETPTAAVP